MARGEQQRPGSRRWRLLPAAAALLFGGLALDAARLETPTIDEFAQVAAGHALLAHGNTGLYAKNPPLGKALLALPGRALGPATPRVLEPDFAWGPWQYGVRFMRANGDRYLGLFTPARAVVVVFSLLTAALVFVWTRDLFGERAAAIATALLLVQPTLLAHGHLATVDVMCTALVFASVFALRRACAAPGPGRVALAGAVWGVALLVKFTALLLLPVFAGLLAWRNGRRVSRTALEIALAGGVALLVVNAGMGFRGAFTPLGEFRMASQLGRSLQAGLPTATPVPLPRDYLRGLDAQQRDVEQGEFPFYLCGEWSEEGWWYYEAVALLVKTPLPVSLLLAACPFAPVLRRTPARELAFLWLPIAVLGLLLTALNALNIGIRYLLPLHPFAFVLLGGIFAGGRAGVGAGLAALIWCAATVAWVHPSHLAYFNLAAGGPASGSDWLLDSNFDWGQDLYRLPAALDDLDAEGPVHLLYFGHVDPGLYGIDFRVAPRAPVRGVVAASVTYLKGFSYPAAGPGGRPVRVRHDHLAWLRGREPVARLGSIHVFDTREDAPR